MITQPYTIEQLIQKVRDGFKIKELHAESKRIVLVGNEQISVGKEDLIRTKLAASDEEIQEFIRSPFYLQALLQVHERGVVLVDLADFSKLSNDEQVKLITRFQVYLRHIINLNQKYIESVLSTGDGYFIIFHQDFHRMLKFVMALISQLSFYNFEDVGVNKFYFRISVNIGDVHFFYDINDRLNYVGDAMNDAKRLIDMIPHTKENTVYLDEQVYKKHLTDGYKFSSVQSQRDKHNKEHRFVELIYKYL